jgi:xylan 1,4-beta-xylosidase
MFGMMKGKRVEVTGNRMYDLKTFVDCSVRKQTDIGGLAALDKRSATIMIWNYHDEDLQDIPEEITININRLPAKTVTLTEYRIDNEHGNSYEVWKKMGSPQNPTANQITTLEKSGQLKIKDGPRKISIKDKTALKLLLPRQGVIIIKAGLVKNYNY